MRKTRTAIWTVIGAIVGAFLMPSTWLVLLYLTAGRAFINNFNDNGILGSDQSIPTMTTNPDTGFFEPPAATSHTSTPGWVTALLVVSLAVTVLSAVFFGWVGHRLATRTSAQEEPAQ